MADLALEKYIKRVETKYQDLMTEQEVCELLGFNRNYFLKMRTQKIVIPFLKIGGRITYLKEDVIEYLKKSRRM